MQRRCPRCKDELSPWEDGVCLSCRDRSAPPDINLADCAVRALEKEDCTVRVYDIARSIRRERDQVVNMSSLHVALARDLRICWGGKGLYGLYRHQLFPGPRRLGSIGHFFLLAASKPVRVDHLSFAMKNVGYRFQDGSLRTALYGEPRVEIVESNKGLQAWSETGERILYHMGFAPTMRDFDEMLQRARRFLAKGVEEYKARVVNGTSA